MIRNSMNEYIRNTVEDKGSVAVLLSGGMDSLSVLLSCLDLGIRPTLYTFYLKSHISNDIKSSRKISKCFNLPLVEIEINDDDINKLEADVEYIIKTFKVKKKTAVQCIYPFLYVVPEIKEKYVLSGLCADDLYGTIMSITRHRKEPEVFNELRNMRVNNQEASYYKQIKELHLMYNKTFISPYKECNDIIEYLLPMSYDEMNKPKVKNILYIEYKDEIDTHSLYRPGIGLQVCSKVREQHDKLLATDLNTGDFKSVVAIYNRKYSKFFND